MAVPVGAVEAKEGLKFDLVDDVEEEPGEVALGEPVAQVGWEIVPASGRSAQTVQVNRYSDPRSPSMMPWGGQRS